MFLLFVVVCSRRLLLCVVCCVFWVVVVCCSLFVLVVAAIWLGIDLSAAVCHCLLLCVVASCWSCFLSVVHGVCSFVVVRRCSMLQLVWHRCCWSCRFLCLFAVVCCRGFRCGLSIFVVRLLWFVVVGACCLLLICLVRCFWLGLFVVVVCC